MREVMGALLDSWVQKARSTTKKEERLDIAYYSLNGFTLMELTRFPIVHVEDEKEYLKVQLDDIKKYFTRSRILAVYAQLPPEVALATSLPYLSSLVSTFPNKLEQLPASLAKELFQIYETL